MAPFLFAVMQSAVTTGIACGIASFNVGDTLRQFLGHWTLSWGVSWLVMLPVVIGLAPILRRLIGNLVQPA